MLVQVKIEDRVVIHSVASGTESRLTRAKAFCPGRKVINYLNTTTATLCQSKYKTFYRHNANYHILLLVSSLQVYILSRLGIIYYRAPYHIQVKVLLKFLFKLLPRYYRILFFPPTSLLVKVQYKLYYTTFLQLKIFFFITKMLDLSKLPKIRYTL